VKEYVTLIWTFFKIGIMTFGGGYAMLPIIQREVVENKGWATQEEILNYYAIGQCTPGIIAVNTATFIGNKQKGILGGFLATFGLVFPSLIIISLIAALLTSFADIPAVQHALGGIRVAVVVLVGASVIKLAKAGVKNAMGWVLFVGTFLVSALLGLSPVAVVLTAALVGVLAGLWSRRGAQP
jgi:chromate transporter